MNKVGRNKVYITIILAFSMIISACDTKSNSINIVDFHSETPEYLSFFYSKHTGNHDMAKYWGEAFIKLYDRQVYINYDQAAYYNTTGLSYRELLSKRMQSSLPDDLYIINAEDVIEYERLGYWMDLSNLNFVDNLSEAALRQSTYHGKVFSLPLDFTGFGFLWNLDMLQKYGLEIPANLAEFMHVCETLKAAGITPYGANKGYALTIVAMGRGLSQLYLRTDVEEQIEALNQGEVSISTYVKDGYLLLSEMMKKGYFDPQQALDTAPESELDAFLAGEYAFISSGLGMIAKIPEDAPFAYEITGLPLLEDGYTSIYGADSRLCVNPNSKQLDVALKFIEMVGVPEALDKNAELNQTLSTARNSNLQTITTKQPLAQQLLKPGQVPNQDFSLHFNTWESIRNVAREICKGMRVEDALKMLDELQNKERRMYSN